MRLPRFDEFLKRRYRRRRRPKLRVPFVGREDLLATLDARLKEATDGGQAFVVLEGPAGSGKSALLEEFLARCCRSTAVLPLLVNAADFLLAEDVFITMLVALQSRSRQITEKLFRDTRRLRTLKGLNWEEAEFTRMIAAPGVGQAGRATAAPANLLERVRQHPWATAAAVALDGLNRGVENARLEPKQRFVHLLGSIRDCIEPGNAVMIVVIDQLEGTEDAPVDAALAESVQPDWGAVAEALIGTRMPALVVWAGTAEGVWPVGRSLSVQATLTTCVLESLADDEWQQLRRTRGALPAGGRAEALAGGPGRENGQALPLMALSGRRRSGRRQGPPNELGNSFAVMPRLS